MKLPSVGCSSQNIANKAYVTIDGYDSNSLIFPISSAAGEYQTGVPENPYVKHLDTDSSESDILNNESNEVSISLP